MNINDRAQDDQSISAQKWLDGQCGIRAYTAKMISPSFLANSLFRQSS